MLNFIMIIKSNQTIIIRFDIACISWFYPKEPSFFIVKYYLYLNYI